MGLGHPQEPGCPEPAFLEPRQKGGKPGRSASLRLGLPRAISEPWAQHPRNCNSSLHRDPPSQLGLPHWTGATAMGKGEE